MTVTSIDPGIAIIVVDPQKGIVDLRAAHPIAEIVARASVLADAFRHFGRFNGGNLPHETRGVR